MVTCFNKLKLPSAIMDSYSSISFTLNGEKVEVTDVSPSLTLIEWLRSQPGLTGTKKMCGEGGCGCCVVSATMKNPLTQKLSTIAINSVRRVENILLEN